MQIGKVVKTASASGGKFLVGIQKNSSTPSEHVEADYLLIASGSSSQVGTELLVFAFSFLYSLRSSKYIFSCYRAIVLQPSLVIRLWILCQVYLLSRLQIQS